MDGTVFVGREAELERLHRLLDDALAGNGGACFLAGDAGSGKTALIGEFVRQAQERHEHVVVAAGRCNAQTGAGEPYLPFMEILSLLSGDEGGKLSNSAISENNATRLSKLARSSTKVLVDYAPDIVSAFIPGSSLVAKIGKSIIKESGVLAKFDQADKAGKAEPAAELDSQKIFSQYTDLVSNISRESPLIVVLDDMHWADSASINLFSHLGAKLRDSKVLLLGTHRPNDITLTRGDERHPLIFILNEMKRCYGDIVIDMDAISREERKRFVDMLVDAEPNRLGTKFHERLFLHTNGHPLFTVELLQSLKESGSLIKDSDGCWIKDGELDWLVLPPRVEGVIEERIGRLEEKMREIITVCSIEGQSFTAQVVAHLHEMSEREMLKYLSQELEKRHRLVKEGGTEKIGKNWLSQFSFSQTVFQQYLYNGMSEREKMILHGEVAELLEEFYKDKRDMVLLQLARHYEISGEAEKAAACLVRASALAIRISAYEEARQQLLRALELMADISDGQERQSLELDAQLSLSVVYKATLGWDSPEVKKAYYRTRELCNQLNRPAQLAPVIFGLWAIHLMQLELQDALLMAQEYRQLAEEMKDDHMLLHAHVAIGNTCYWMGNIQDAYDSMDTAFRMYDPQYDYLAEFGQDPRILILIFQGFSAWLLGRADQAKEYEKQTLSLAESLSHHFSMAIALYGAVTMDYHRRDIASMKPRVEKLIQLTREHHFPLYLGLGMVYGGWIKAMEGRPEEGIPELEEGFEQWICKHGGRVTHSLYCVMMAEALQCAGLWEKGLSIVENGLAVIQQCHEHCYEPELHRLKGELLCEFADGRKGEAEDAFERALQTSRAQGEKILELRGAVSLARFWQESGRKAEALALLNGVCQGFSEGLDIPDLLGAKALIESLGAGVEQPG